jgi:hypothetical protein
MFIEKRTRAEFRQIDPGLYVDDAGACCICISEFLAAHGIPDVLEIRQVLLEEIDLAFPEIICIEFLD